MTPNLCKAEEYLSVIGAEKYAEQLVEKMNQAAEEAAPLALDIFVMNQRSIQGNHTPRSGERC
ncbi:DUF4197 family protein [bacterium]|nr:DUF4197 family protein [bacterium]